MAPGSTPTGPTGPVAHIKWKTDQTLCATVQGTPADGTAVALASCDNSNPLQKFYTFDNGPIQLVGTNYCFDAGIDPKDATTMKIWTCYKGLSQQTWQYPNGTQEIVTANSKSRSGPPEPSVVSKPCLTYFRRVPRPRQRDQDAVSVFTTLSVSLSWVPEAAVFFLDQPILFWFY